MATEIKMPQLSDTMDEGKILTWLKQEGDQIKRGDALAEVATDKADLEVESFHEGTLLKIHASVGEKVKVGSIIATIGEAGEKVAEKSATKAVVEDKQVRKQEEPRGISETVSATPALEASNQTSSSDDSHRLKISPLARNIAKAHNVDYSGIRGSGDGGRIVKRDLEAVIGQGQTLPVVGNGSVKSTAERNQQAAVIQTPVNLGSTQSLSKMRQTIATRMVESKTSIPHFYVTAKVEVSKLESLRTTLKPLPNYEGITLTHLLVKAVGLSLTAFPRINAAYKDNALVQSESINVGIITALADGLLIPILKNVERLSLADIVQNAQGLVNRARAGKPKADDLVGGTFSISNMGKFEVESFSAIISPGQGAILAVSSIQTEPVVINNMVEVGRVIRLTLSVDHRIIDGVMAGEFLTKLKKLLEEPVLLLA
jgi:pyruvate dehydrogenase E2 component (dihydrolipoamide acetyltransferase)